MEMKEEVIITELTKEEKIKFLVDAVWHVEGVQVKPSFFEDLSDEALDSEVEFYDYVLDK